MSVGDKINSGLLIAAIVGITLTYLQVRSSARTQRAQFLKDLYSTLAADPDVMDAYYQIEYGQFHYGDGFHGSDIEPRIDRLLGFADLVSELFLQKIISKRELVFFEYRFRRIYENPEVRQYLNFLTSFYKQTGSRSAPYQSFQRVAQELLSNNL